MTRNAVRNNLLLGCLSALALFHLLWPTQASQPSGFDSRVLKAFVARNVGPATMTGRITSIAGVDKDPKVRYVAAASGGVMKTVDGGETFTLHFDREGSVSIGDIQVSQSNPKIVWVGTGEQNVRNSVAWGDGVYKSEDGGLTWKNMGLRDSHTIGRIAIHPTDPNIVYVGALGHIWGPNKERGVFKTTNGGKTWDCVKFIDEDTGFIDLKMDPSDPNTLYGCAYRFRRDAFSGSDNPSTFFLGDKAGLYKTADGGKTWEHLMVATPESKYGRCGVDIYRKDPNIVYAVVQTDKTPVGEVNQGGANATAKDNPGMGGVYRSDDKGKTWKHMNTICPRPFYYGYLRVDPNDDQRVFVLGVGTVISSDGGKNFSGGKGKGVEDEPGGGGFFEFDPFDITQIDQKQDQKKDDQKKDDPKKDEQKKGGKGGGGGNVHSDHHALWINPNDSNEVWIGTDGGFGISKDKGKSYRVPRPHCLGQFYGIAVDMRKPYFIYGGLQDNGSSGGASATREDIGIRLNAWGSMGIGGDGFHTACDPTDWTIVYGESQYGGFSKGKAITGGGGGKKGQADAPDDQGGGALLRLISLRDVLGLDQLGDQKQGDQKQDDKKKDDQKKDDPKKDDPKKGGKGGGGGGKGGVKSVGTRFNWSCPLALSPHDPKIVYYGAEGLLASERGANPWKKMSPDLTYGPDKGGKGGKGRNWAHTLFTLNESPKKKGVIWTGADDGCVAVTKDNGENWKKITIPLLPKEGCVSRVEPSYHEDGTCYVSITRYRNDDRKPYIFKTTDYGENWTNVTGNLPDGSVHVVIESSKNRNLLFCGTEFAIFCTLNGGQTWHRMDFPTVAVHDLVIHPRDRDLVVGTHGRSVWVFDDISPLEQMTPDVLAKGSHLFGIRPAEAFKVIKGTPPPKGQFVGQNPPYGALIRYSLRGAGQPVTVSIHDAAGKEIANLKTTNNPGINEAVWNLRANGADTTVEPGEYRALLEIGGQRQLQRFNVVPEEAPAAPKKDAPPDDKKKR